MLGTWPFFGTLRSLFGLGGRPRITAYPLGAGDGLKELISGGCPVDSKFRWRIDKIDLQNVDCIWILLKVFPCQKLRTLPG